VGQGFRTRQVINRDDIKVGIPFQRCPEVVAADTSESVDSNTNSHFSSLLDSGSIENQ